MFPFLLFIVMSFGFSSIMMYFYWRSIDSPGDSFTHWMKSYLGAFLEERRESRRESNVTSTRDLPEYDESQTRSTRSLRASEREAEIAELEALFNREDHS